MKIFEKNITEDRGVKTLNFLLFICNELPIYFKNNLDAGLEFGTSFVQDDPLPLHKFFIEKKIDTVHNSLK